MNETRNAASRGATNAIVAFFVAALGLAGDIGCKHEPSLDERADQRIVATKFDPTADFAAFESFAVPDTVVLETTSLDGGLAPAQTLAPTLADPILREIASQLASRGYREVPRSDGPDTGVAVTALARLKVQTLPYGAWWGSASTAPDYWGYPDASFASGVIYDTFLWIGGTLIIELVDLRAARSGVGPTGPTITQSPTSISPRAEASPRSSLRVVWAALIHGVVRETDQSLAEPPIESIQQAFRQSPYVHR